MGKIFGNVGQVFICYKDEQPTFNIVTNGDETASGGKDDGIFEYRQLTHKDMMNGDILDQMAKKNTLVGWEKYVRTPDNSASTPPPDSKPPKPSDPPGSTSEPKPDPTPAQGTKPPAGKPPTQNNSPLTDNERKSLADVIAESGMEGLNTEELKAVSEGKFRDMKPYPDAVTAAQKLTANDNALAREIDQKGDKDGRISIQEINPHRKPSEWTEKHARDVANLMQKAGVERLSAHDIHEISHNNWSKYKGPLTQNETDAAKILAENGNSRLGLIDAKGNKDGFLQINELIPGSPTPPGSSGTQNKPPLKIDPNNVKLSDIVAVYPHTWEGSKGTTPFTHLVNDIKRSANLEGTGQLYLSKENIRYAADNDPDPNKRAIFNKIHSLFEQIDYVKYNGHNILGTQNFEDGLIGAGDLEKFFGWNQNGPNR